MFLLIEAHNSKVNSSRHVEYDIHPDADWFLVRGANITAKIKARQAYPGTFCERRADGGVLLGYGSRQVQNEDEFLHIELSNDGSIRIQRDVQCTLPIFYGQSGDVFVVSNEYKELIERLPHLTLDLESLSKNLLNITPTSQYTIWKEIKVLGERQALRFKDGEPVFAPTATSRPWAFSTDLAQTDPRAFPKVLKERFTHFINTRLKNNALGVELSGGLDSAFLPLFMATNGHVPPAHAGTLVQPDPNDKARQLQKLSQIEALVPLRSKRVHLNPERHYPLVDMIGSNKFWSVDHVHDPYEAPTAEMATHFQDLGVTVVATGSGGDQLLEHRPHPTVLASRQPNKTMPPFLTNLCHVPPEAQDPSAPPATLLSNTIVYENLAQANTYINRGIWPVSPFHDVPLFNYCQALPIQFRANKNIFRAYFEANGFPEMLYKGPNEYFSTFFNTCLLSGKYDALLQHLADRSVTAQMGYVDIEKLITLFSAMRKGMADTEPLFSIYTWMRLELNLQFAPRWSVEKTT